MHFIRKLIKFICILIFIIIINKSNIQKLVYEIKTEKIIEEKNYIDYIEILNQKMIIKKGNEKEILDSNYVYWMNNSKDNNIFLAGHNSKLVFNILYNLKINDRVYLYLNNKNLIYEVIDIKYINVDDYYIYNEKDYFSLTLITCSYTNQKRYIVICRLIE